MGARRAQPGQHLEQLVSWPTCGGSVHPHEFLRTGHARDVRRRKRAANEHIPVSRAITLWPSRKGQTEAYEGACARSGDGTHRLW